jgi:predicted MFS family arabinose efflux permease
MPIGAAVGGIVGERFGVTAVFWTAAALGATCIPLLLTQLGDAGISAEEEPFTSTELEVVT